MAYSSKPSAAGEEAGSYDAVFAMAVFRHGELGGFPPACSHLLRFDAFEQALAELAICLKPGGLLLLRHANCRFTDTRLADGFDLLLEAPRHSATPLYGRDERLLAPQPDLEGVAFRKRVS